MAHFLLQKVCYKMNIATSGYLVDWPKCKIDMVSLHQKGLNKNYSKLLYLYVIRSVCS